VFFFLEYNVLGYFLHNLDEKDVKSLGDINNDTLFGNRGYGRRD
jgi:hypothetical protein